MRRILIIKYELRRQLLKSLMKSQQNTNMERLNARYQFTRIPRLARTTQAQFRCLTLGRARGVNTRYGLSRFAFRNAANRGLITAVRRGS